jgi:hypothetical protein
MIAAGLAREASYRELNQTFLAADPLAGPLAGPLADN